MTKVRKVESIKKRDGREEKFDPNKIIRAVEKCLMNGSGTLTHSDSIVSKDISKSVVNILERQEYPLTVEVVQRLTQQQMWSLGLFDAAERYLRYVDEKTRLREELVISPEDEQRILEDSKHFPTPLQYYQFISKFSRWREEEQRRETWREACDRSMNWLKGLPQIKGLVTEQEWDEMDSALYNMEATCSMRLLQMAGPAATRENLCIYNCSAIPLCDLRAFVELLYILMQGTGCGFSVESEYVEKLPKIKKQKSYKNKSIKKHQIEDSTEGWCNALLVGLEAWFSGNDVEFDYSLIRPAGARLLTKGGRSSGPSPLRQLLEFAKSLILKNQDGYLSDLDAHDLACMIGKIVQVGGVRRAACISVSDLDSQKMRTAKSGNWYEKHVYRSMSNNSAAYNEPIEDTDFLSEWQELVSSGSGERGIFNRYGITKNIPKRRKSTKFLPNPCALLFGPSYQ